MRRALVLLTLSSATAAAGCTPRWGVDPAFAASVAPIGLPTSPDGAIRIGDWLLVGGTPPMLVERESRDLQMTFKEIRSALGLRAPDGTLWTGACKLDGSDGGLWLEGHWSIECDFVGGHAQHRLSFSGQGGGDLFDVRRLSGTVEDLSEGATGRDALLGRGTMRAMTFHRQRRDPGFDARTLDAVAAISVARPEALYLSPALDDALRVDVMLAAGTLVSLRAVEALPKRP